MMMRGKVGVFDIAPKVVGDFPDEVRKGRAVAGLDAFHGIVVLLCNGLSMLTQLYCRLGEIGLRAGRSVPFRVRVKPKSQWRFKSSV